MKRIKALAFLVLSPLWVLAHDLEKPKITKLDYDEQIRILHTMLGQEWVTCRMTYGYSWSNLDQFGKVQPTVLIQKINKEDYLVSYTRNLDHGLPVAREQLTEDAMFEYFQAAIGLAEEACNQAKLKDSQIVDRWIYIQMQSKSRNLRKFTIGYWGDSEAFTAFREHIEKWSEQDD